MGLRSPAYLFCASHLSQRLIYPPILHMSAISPASPRKTIESIPKGSSHRRISRHGWGDRILRAQDSLLKMHCSHPLSRYSVSVGEGRVINVVQTIPSPTSESSSILVLTHGWGAGLAYFSRSLPLLIPHFRSIYLLDLPGMGASSRASLRATSIQDTLQYFTRDLDTFVSTLEKTDVTFQNAKHKVLGAHSLGAYIFTEWLLESSPDFDAFIMISPVGIPERSAKRDDKSSRPALYKRALLSIATSCWERGVTPQSMLKFFPTPVRRRFCETYIHNRYFGEYKEGEFDLLVEYCQAMSVAPCAGERAATRLLSIGAWAHAPLMQRLREIEIPTAFIYGEQDWMDWTAGFAASQQMKVRTELRRVPEADHNVFIDNAKGFVDAVLESVDMFEECWSETSSEAEYETQANKTKSQGNHK